MEKFLERFYQHPKKALFIFIIISTLLAIPLMKIEWGEEISANQHSVIIILQHFGMDSQVIEETLTKPMEELLSLVNGIKEITSVSDYGKSRISVTLHPKTDPDKAYLEIRDGVDRLYANLPDSVQKPQIYSGNGNQKPIFVVSFHSAKLTLPQLRSFVEEKIKPNFESLDGVGEIEVGGGQIQEVHIKVLPEKMVTYNLNIETLASIIKSNNIISPIGEIITTNKSDIIILDSRIKKLEDFKSILVPVKDSTPVQLKEICSIDYGYRELESISKIDGKEKIVLYIKDSGNSNLIQLSTRLKQLTTHWSTQKLDVDIILDGGAELKTNFRNLLITLGVSILIVIFSLLFFIHDFNKILLLALSLPVTTLFTFSILSLMKITISTQIIAGMAVGLGMIVDAGIIIISSPKPTKVIKALVASTLTTIIVLIPLLISDLDYNGSKSVSLSIIVMQIIALLLNIFFLPAFITQKEFHFDKKGATFSLKMINKIEKIPTWIFGTMTIVPLFILIFILFFTHLNVVNEVDSKSIYLQYELDSGTNVKTVDKYSNIVEKLLYEIPHVNRIEVTSKKNQSTFNIIVEESKYSEKVKSEINQISKSISPGFLYMPEAPQQKTTRITITLEGKNNQILRDECKRISGILNQADRVKSVILHFKEPQPGYKFSIDPIISTQNQLSTDQIGSLLRWNLYGPVALKWTENFHETDLRIRAKDGILDSPDKIENLVIQTQQGTSLPLSLLGKLSLTDEFYKIYRKDRHRALFLTVETNYTTIQEANQELRNLLLQTHLPDGYTFEMDKNAAELEKIFQNLIITIILSLFLVFLALGIFNNSLIDPLFIVSIIAPSLIPVGIFILIKNEITIPILIGIIILTGSIVNNSIIILDQFKKELTLATPTTPYKTILVNSIQVRLIPLLLTTLTTLLGLFPLTLVKLSNYVTTISITVFLGLLGSFFSAVLIFPGVLRYYWKNKQKG